MAYIPAVPEDANELPSASQPKITENFKELDRIFGKDHTKFSTEADGGGKHKFLTMPKQTDSTRPATGENEGALYLKEVNSKLNLFLRQQNSGTETNVTERDIEITTGDQGKIVLNNNLIIIWGKAKARAAARVASINFHTRFPSEAFFVTFQMIRNNDRRQAFLKGFNQQGFTLYIDLLGEEEYYYFAIGQ